MAIQMQRRAGPLRKASTVEGRGRSGEGRGVEGRGVEGHMETIYGGEEGFLDKYREYQISLLEKIPSYRSKHLTLDYKNEWRL